MLAYSSIAQIGYMLLGISFMTEGGLTATVIHLFNHGITKAALFMGVGAFVMRGKGSFLAQISGVGKTMPWTSAAVVIAGFSLIGVPGTAGFISKWLLVQAALEKGWWPIAVLVLLSSLLAAIYVWQVIETMYLKPATEATPTREAPLAMLIPIWILALSTIYFGLDTQLTLTAAQTAAQGLMAGSSGMQ
jgi:multicomponent Na+:H+ antiporter subunit D